MASMRSNGGSSRGSDSGTMVFWDMQTVPPPPNFEFLDHLLGSHRAMGTGLFSLCPPLKIRAHGIEALPAAAHKYIVESTLFLQQSISCGSEQGSSWKAMIVDMLLWATDHAPGMVDMVIISRVSDPSLADAIHQLHIRKYNIIVTTSFPPKRMTPLHECVPPQIEILHQMFLHSLLNDTMEVAVEEKPLVARINDESSIRANDSQSQQNQMTTVCSLLMGNCRILVEEYLREGITEFLEYDLYARFKTRFMNKLSFKKVGFEKLDAFLQVAVPGVSFKRILVGTKPWILCNSPGLDYGARHSRLISEARPATPPRQVLNYGPLSMEEVRNWLEELVASGRANAGINISNLGKDFEDRRGKKLNYKSLQSPNLMALLSKFETLVRLERKESMVHLFPRDSRRAPPTVPGNVPVRRPFTLPQKNEASLRPPCSSFPSFVQAPAQTSIARNMPTAMPVPKFGSMAPITTTVRASAEAFVKVPRSPAPFTSEVHDSQAACEQVSDDSHLNHLPNISAAGRTGAVTEKDQQSLLPKTQQKSEPSIRDILAAHKPDSISGALKTTSTPPPDLVKDANSAREPKAEQAGEQHPLPNADNTGVPTPGVDKVHQARIGEDPGAFSDAGNGKKFDYYGFTSTPEEREAIKRTFESVNRRLREEFKKRKIAQEAQVAEACDRANNTP